jgi:uncharacterized protein (TIGR03083 family)
MTVDHIAVLAEQSARFHAAAAHPEALRHPVSACPGWTGKDLVHHLGEVQAFWTHAVRAAGEPPDEDAVAAAQKPGDDLLAWARRWSDELVGALRATPPDTPVWVWWNDEQRDSAAEVAGRQAHEVLVHRWDAEALLDHPAPVDPQVWADGIDEFARRFLSGPPWSGPSGVVAIRTTDLAREWRFGVGTASHRDGGRPVWLRDKRLRELDAIMTGTAEQLDLMLWRRTEPDRAAIEGDADLFLRFLSWPQLD